MYGRSDQSAGDDGLVTVFLCGDVMTGRGVDQVLPHPGDPRLWEAYTRDARAYVSLAEAANGPIPAPVAFRWPWGDALDVLADIGPELRVVNLETSITRSDDVAVGKAVTYRMNPANVGCLTAAAPDVCALANNHILDFGYRGLDETLETLAAANISAVGAGRDVDAAGRPATIARERGGRFLVFSVGLPSSGIPENWGATRERPGVSLVPEPATAAATIARIAEFRRPDDIVIVSVHWGSNWGYDVPRGQVAFAHQLVDGGVDIVHGHSSHHPRPVEVYRGRLILYGCGDFIDDYEGIGGHEEYRDDLRLLYFVTVKAATGQLVALRAVPMQARQLRLHRASLADTAELAAVLSRISHDFGARFDRAPDGALALQSVPPA